MEIKIVREPISKKELEEIAGEEFGDMVKAVIDIEQEIMAVGGELHSDEEVLLIEKENSRQESLWGINIYPKKLPPEWVEFDSMINLRPRSGNHSRDVENPETRRKIAKIVRKLIIG